MMSMFSACVSQADTRADLMDSLSVRVTYMPPLLSVSLVRAPQQELHELALLNKQASKAKETLWFGKRTSRQALKLIDLTTTAAEATAALLLLLLPLLAVLWAPRTRRRRRLPS